MFAGRLGALVFAAGVAEPYGGCVTHADDCLAELAPVDLDEWEREHLAPRFVPGGSPAREASRLAAAAREMVLFMLALTRRFPGEELEEDATTAALVALARRSTLLQRSAGLEERLLDRNLRLLARLDALIADWPEPQWTDLVRSRLETLVGARRRGAERGRQLRASRPPAPVSRDPSGAWLLRHPGDHRFRAARAAIDDPPLCAIIDEWIADFAPSYGALASGDWSAQEARADLVVDLEFGEAPVRDWRESVTTVVLASHHGGASIRSELSLRFVADPDARFNGTLISALAGERWRTCARALPDSSIVPEDGTRRLEA